MGHSTYVRIRVGESPGRGCVVPGATEAAQDGSALVVEENVRRLDRPMPETKIVQISHSCGDGGTEPGDHLRRLGVEPAQIAPRHPSQDERIRRVTAIYLNEADHARMGQRLQQGGLGRQLGAVLRRAGSLDHHLVRFIM
jgi:hypothetical protein